MLNCTFVCGCADVVMCGGCVQRCIGNEGNSLQPKRSAPNKKWVGAFSFAPMLLPIGCCSCCIYYDYYLM